jgi:hypothetical protein
LNTEAFPTSLIYRVEDEEGKGPYMGSYDVDEWTEGSHVGDHHPTPMSDGIEFWKVRDQHGNNNILCGFRDMDQLRKWFTCRELTNLYDMGLRVKVYQVNRDYIWHGNMQVVYHKEWAECVG